MRRRSTERSEPLSTPDYGLIVYNVLTAPDKTGNNRIIVNFNMQEDKLLIEQFKDPATKERAYTAIIKKYQERLYWHIRRLLVEHEDTNDVMQNVFIKVWNALENFREDSQLYTWLYRIATNESLTFIDQRKRKSADYSLSDVEGALENKIRADRNFDANKLEWKLQLAIQQLPEKQRVVFTLRYYDEMPYEEMSRVLETSEGSLKASYHHAAKKIEDYILKNSE
ncbi:sigma-70 family RNA polymerase sigma factor [Chitinophagaceae bacterium LY-5]|uniref:Sigma-70 family RNA polymerase sigma factor n=2 Tax=Polluticaenibacter yanchengensis TaxID=3014562 RepID=A0ABT4UKJ8_9BACT|nr:sigma-70 family RNA polymerase sigma factor [Chitinophagaceae bacterium LY-5]